MLDGILVTLIEPVHKARARRSTAQTLIIFTKAIISLSSAKQNGPGDTVPQTPKKGTTPVRKSEKIVKWAKCSRQRRDEVGRKPAKSSLTRLD